MSEPATDDLWAKIYGSAVTHPKIRHARKLAGSAAIEMWAMGLAYTRLHRSDGLVHGEALPMLTASKAPRKVALALVGAGLWAAVGDEDFRIHDFGERSGTQASIRAGKRAPSAPVGETKEERSRRQDAERKARRRAAEKSGSCPAGQPDKCPGDEPDNGTGQGGQRPVGLSGLSGGQSPGCPADMSGSRSSDPEEKDEESEEEGEKKSPAAPRARTCGSADAERILDRLRSTTSPLPLLAACADAAFADVLAGAAAMAGRHPSDVLRALEEAHGAAGARGFGSTDDREVRDLVVRYVRNAKPKREASASGRRPPAHRQEAFDDDEEERKAAEVMKRGAV